MSNVDELRTGALVTKAVRLVRPLAEGGMGMVWVAEHLTLGTEVVVKFMTPAVADCEGAAARFSREASAAAAVKSPHVIQVFDSGISDAGLPYIVMELLDGRDLGAYLETHGPMSPLAVLAVVTQVAKALTRAHKIGVVHRDIKPENIFLCDVEGDELFVKLLDFGTAKHADHDLQMSTTGQLAGTPYYMSPEQILGESTDPRSDVWALGVVAFEALTGKRPFDGSTLGAITLAIHAGQPRLADVSPELPPGLDDWFAKACARDVADRFATVRDAADALHEVVLGEPPRSRESIEAPSLTPGPCVVDASPPAVALVATSTNPRLRSSLSETLNAPEDGRRSMVWIAGGVAAAAVAAMIALVMHGGDAKARSGLVEAPAETSSSGPFASALAATAQPPHPHASARPAPPSSAAHPEPSASAFGVAPIGSAVPATPAPASSVTPKAEAAPAPSPRKVSPPAASASSKAGTLSPPAVRHEANAAPDPDALPTFAPRDDSTTSQESELQADASSHRGTYRRPPAPRNYPASPPVTPAPSSDSPSPPQNTPSPDFDRPHLPPPEEPSPGD